MKAVHYILVSIFVYILLQLCSCANYKLNIANDKKDWESKLPDPDLAIVHSMYLVGDAGNSPLGGLAPPLQLLDDLLATHQDSVTVLFLGDNIYPAGLPPKRVGAERQQAEHRLLAQLRVVADKNVRPIFMPGNHDWRTYGLKGLRRQEDYVEEYLNDEVDDPDDWENYFLPDRGCGGPQLVEINDQLVVIVLDSQWWLLDWNKEPRINDGCEAKSRKVFTFLFEEMLRKHRHKNVVIALHHPPYSNGTHGGFYTARQHLFPLTDINENLMIPIPFIGTIASLYRGMVGSKQDIAHTDYKELRTVLISAARKNGSFIFASGHEHNLQLFKLHKQAYIVSGSGSKTGPTRLGNGAEFAYGRKGLARIDFYEDGSAWVQFYVVKASAKGRVVYREKLKDALPVFEQPIPQSYENYAQHKDSVQSLLLNREVKKSGPIHKLFLGKHFRDLYTYQYGFPVLDMQRFKGGISPVKRGGGNQTNSLRLKSADGQQYVMRSMTKDASRFIPYPFNKIAAAEFIVEDNFLSTHPFAAIVVPPLADAVGVYHANPHLYYVPKQPLLGSYNDQFGNEVYLVEERPAGNWQGLASFGNSRKIISTPNLAEKIVKDHKHYVDQQWVIKSRLFDMVIGDWDRHDDQWRWATFKDDKGRSFYRPVPRDRDQPFSKYDGFFAGVARLTLPFLKQLKPYKAKAGNSKWANYNARQFDKTFLNALSWQDWKQAAEKIQAQLTDDIIEEAFKVWPKQAYEQSASEVMSILKKRRDNLLLFAKKHYDLIVEDVDVYGSDKRDLFEVERLNDRETLVRVYDTNKIGERERLLYQRLFLTDETDEIHLYGLGGKDIFRIKGEVRKGPKLRIVGGLGADVFVDSSNVHGWSKKTLIYDTTDGNELTAGPDTKNKLSDRREWNLYNRKDFHYEYDFMVPLPGIGYNPDDGLFLGAQLTFTNYQYKKVPYGQQHIVKGQFAFATNAYNLQYSGDYLEALGRYDVLIDATVQAPSYTINYFGLGNDTERQDVPDGIDDADYYRVKQSLYSLQTAVKKRFLGGAGKLKLGPLVERVRIERTTNRFVTQPDNGLPPDVFDSRYFGGLVFGLDLESIDKLQMTNRGVLFNSQLGLKARLNEMNRNFLFYKLEMSIYQSFTQQNRIVLATRIGMHHNIGDYEFYQSAMLGGRSNLRAQAANRFYGDRNFYHNTDIRIKLFYLKNNIMPFSVGVIGGFDYGRVWLDGENSNTWHTAYGGGLWIAPVDFIILRGTLFREGDEQRISIGVGYDF